MGRIRQNAWLYEGDHQQKVWALCADCKDRGLERIDYWVNIVPDKFSTIDKLKTAIDQTPNKRIEVLCNSRKHVVGISGVWFARKKLFPP